MYPLMEQSLETSINPSIGQSLHTSTNQSTHAIDISILWRQVMLGDNSLGVLRVHLPGLVHKWHEITPWKCLVWVWGGSASGDKCPDGNGCGMGVTDEPPVLSVADALGA